MCIYIKQFSFKNFFGALLYSFGALWLFIEITSFFSHSWGDVIKSYWWLFLIIGTLIGIYRAWPKAKIKSRISGTDVHIEVRIGNLFNQEGALIIGSNTTFDTTLDDNTISKSSIQGQFVNIVGCLIPELDRQLESSLKVIQPLRQRHVEEKPYGKLTEYEFGTVSPIEIGDKKAYFVAIARLNEYRVASSDRNSFLDSLARMWNEIRSKGGMEPLCCPILGSGFSRLNLTREDIIREIIISFVAATIEGKLSEKLTIVINPNDFQAGNIDFKRICKLLEHECNYARPTYQPDSTEPIGTPLDS